MNVRTVVTLTPILAVLVGIRLGSQAGGTRNATTSGAMPPTSLPEAWPAVLTTDEIIPPRSGSPLACQCRGHSSLTKSFLPGTGCRWPWHCRTHSSLTKSSLSEVLASGIASAVGSSTPDGESALQRAAATTMT